MYHVETPILPGNTEPDIAILYVNRDIPGLLPDYAPIGLSLVDLDEFVDKKIRHYGYGWSEEDNWATAAQATRRGFGMRILES